MGVVGAIVKPRGGLHELQQSRDGPNMNDREAQVGPKLRPCAVPDCAHLGPVFHPGHPLASPGWGAQSGPR